MKIAVKEGKIYPESEWADWIKKYRRENSEQVVMGRREAGVDEDGNPVYEDIEIFRKHIPYITEPPYNYQIVVAPDDIDVRKLKPKHFRLEGNSYLFDRIAYEDSVKEEVLAHLRSRRETECFPVINRGTLWYNRLTEEQRTELAAWYQAWLDVTETKIVPAEPAWLKEV